MHIPAMAPRFVMPQTEPRAMRTVRRACIGLFCVHAAFAVWGMYRRIWQVLRVDVRASSTVLTPRSTVSYDVVTTGEVSNRIRLELVQGSHTETLMERRGRLSAINTYDPRLFEAAGQVEITPELLSRFAPGAATIRLIGFGGQKLLHVPPPRVRSLAVELPTPGPGS